MPPAQLRKEYFFKEALQQRTFPLDVLQEIRVSPRVPTVRKRNWRFGAGLSSHGNLQNSFYLVLFYKKKFLGYKDKSMSLCVSTVLLPDLRVYCESQDPSQPVRRSLFYRCGQWHS